MLSFLLFLIPSWTHHLHAVIVLVAAVPLPPRLGNEGPEVGVAHVADVGGESEETPRLEGVVVPALVSQAVGLVGQAVLLHRALSMPETFIIQSYIREKQMHSTDSYRSR